MIAVPGGIMLWRCLSLLLYFLRTLWGNFFKFCTNVHVDKIEVIYILETKDRWHFVKAQSENLLTGNYTLE